MNGPTGEELKFLLGWSPGRVPQTQLRGRSPGSAGSLGAQEVELGPQGSSAMLGVVRQLQSTCCCLVVQKGSQA